VRGVVVGLELEGHRELGAVDHVVDDAALRGQLEREVVGALEVVGVVGQHDVHGNG
jgi:hypothetical protein